MHIVFVISNNPSVPYFTWFAEMAAQEKKHTFSFIALCQNRPKMIDEVSQFGWKCYWLPWNHNRRKTSMVLSFFRLWKLFIKIKPDVVHSHLFADSIPTLLAARFSRVKRRVITKQDTSFHFFYAPKWAIADRFNNFNATDLIPVSNESKEFIIKNEGANHKKITMIHHGIPSKIFTNKSDKNKSELILRYGLQNKIVIGTVARLIEWKGYRYIIESAKKVIKHHHNALFLFVGEGDQKQELEKLSELYGVKNHVIFTGRIDREYIPSLYSILDVYVHAASFEPFGFVIPEAMMNTAPVVSTPTGSALDSIEHKKNGYLVKYKDSKTLTEGILYTINHGKEIGIKGQKTALEKFEFKNMYDNYIKLYERKWSQ